MKEAAELLGSTTEAVRKRAKRGTLDSETDEDGRLYVWVDNRVDDGGDRVDGRVDDHRDELFERMGSEIDHLRAQLAQEREANRENRRLLAAALERIPAIEEAPPEVRESPVTASEGEDHAPAPPEPEKPSWWRRLFYWQ